MEEQKVTVSAIITTHNRCDLLKRAIESAFNQSISSKEVIVVDDASTDETPNVVSAYPSVKFIRIDKRDSKGGNHARNVGLASANGKYVAFLDDDDCWSPNKLEVQIAEAERSGAGVVNCQMTCEQVAADGTAQYEECKILQEGSCLPQNMSREIFCAIPTVTSCILFEREKLLEVGCFDERLSSWQEYELLIRLAQITSFSSVSESLVVYRQNPHDKQRNSNMYFKWRDSVQYVETKHHALIRSLPLYNRLRWIIVKLTDGTGRARDAGLPVRSALLHAANIALRAVSKALMSIQDR